MASIIEDYIHLLFENPTAPIYTLQSAKRESFEITENSMFLAPHLKESFRQYQIHNVDTSLTKYCLNDIVPPKFKSRAPLDADFSQFSEDHKMEVSKLVKIFSKAITLDNLLSLAAYFRDRVNPQMFYYALSFASMHRKGIKPIVGNIVSAFPYKFISAAALRKAIQDRNSNLPITAANPIEVPVPECSIEPEARISYFREDIGVNSHHWHWHLVYANNGERAMVEKDRRGELFYYMHQQMLARYDAERLCNKLNRLKPYYDFREVNQEGYFPNLQLADGSTTPGRPANMVWSDIIRPMDNMVFKISDLEEQVIRVNKTIDEGCFKRSDSNRGTLHNHDYEKLTIDILGDMVEPSILTPSRSLYGEIHQRGHIFIGLIHDPEKKYGQRMGVMGDVATAVRDPLFYKWHKFVDNIFDRFKNNVDHCPRYTRDQLAFSGVTVDGLELVSNRLSIDTKPANKNELTTYFAKSVVKVNGLDFQSRESVYLRITHLNHAGFNYKINITNNGPTRYGTMRIFIAPKFNECGDRFKLIEQRRLFIEMNRYTVLLSQGSLLLDRDSKSSSVTIPFEQTFPDVLTDQNDPKVQDFCTCGWPHHMLLPKGTTSGIVFQMFVMISDYINDVVANTGATVQCETASSFCGIRSQNYPDKQAMGFPFDRSIDSSYTYIEDFAKGKNSQRSNMFVQDFTIRHVAQK